MRWQFKFEPLRWVEIIRLFLIFAIGMGWMGITDLQQTYLLAFLSLLLSEVGRAFSVPDGTIQQANTSAAKIKSAADANQRIEEGKSPAVPPSALMIMLMAASLVALPACGGGMKRAPVLVGQGALAAGQTIGQLQRTVKSLTKTKDGQGVIPAESALIAQQTLLDINANLELVPPLLRSIDAAQQTGNVDASQVIQAITLLQKVSADLSIVVAGIPVSESTKQVLTLIQSGQTTVTTLLVQLGKIQAAFGTALREYVPLWPYFAEGIERYLYIDAVELEGTFLGSEPVIHDAPVAYWRIK